MLFIFVIQPIAFYYLFILYNKFLSITTKFPPILRFIKKLICMIHETGRKNILLFYKT